MKTTISQSDLSRLRIVDVSPFTPLAIGFGGIARSTGAYLSALRKISTEVTLVSTTASLGEEVTPASVEAAYPGVRARLYTPSFSKKWGIGFGLFLYLRTILDAGLVVIHGTRNWPSVIAASLCHIFRRRYLIVAHATLDVERMERTRSKRPFLYSITQAIVMWSARNAAAIIVSGDLERKLLPAAVNRVRVVEIENFFDFDPNQLMPCIAPSENTYLFVGRIESDKGILAFIKTWKVAASPTSRLIIAGTGRGSYFNEVMSAIEGDARITYKGELTGVAVRELMQRSSIVVLPTGLDDSVTENFGNTIAEGLIVGRPAMVTRGLHWDQYRSSPAIISFEVDAGDVARAIKAFEAIDSDSYALMTRAATDLARRFHISNAVKRLQDLLCNEILSRK